MDKLLMIYFLLGAIAPIPSIFLYIFFPSQTVEYFHGEPSETASFWCSVTASADAPVVFLCWAALLSRDAKIHALVLRTFAVYSIFHFGAFWIHSIKQYPEDPLAASYPISILISLAAAAYWGWYCPRQQSSNSIDHYDPMHAPADDSIQ
jgi:hypothetical protein